jgi:hypothetical protein
MAPLGPASVVKCEGGQITTETPKFDYLERGRGVLIDKHPNPLNSDHFSNAQIAVNPAETMAYVIDGDHGLFSLDLTTGVYTQLVSRAAKPWVWAWAPLVSLDGTVLWLCDPYASGMYNITLSGTIIAHQAVPSGNFVPRVRRLVWNAAGTLMYVRRFAYARTRTNAHTPGT